MTDMANGQSQQPPITIIAAILALVALGAATVIGVSVVGINEGTTPLVTTVLGFIGTSLITLLVLVRQTKAENQLTDTTNELRSLGNGKLDDVLRKALKENEANQPALQTLFRKIDEMHAQSITPIRTQVSDIHGAILNDKKKGSTDERGQAI